MLQCHWSRVGNNYGTHHSASFDIPTLWGHKVCTVKNPVSSPWPFSPDLQEHVSVQTNAEQNTLTGSKHPHLWHVRKHVKSELNEEREQGVRFGQRWPNKRQAAQTRWQVLINLSRICLSIRHTDTHTHRHTHTRPHLASSSPGLIEEFSDDCCSLDDY